MTYKAYRLCELFSAIIFIAVGILALYVIVSLFLFTVPVHAQGLTEAHVLPDTRAPEYRWHWVERPLTYALPVADLAITRVAIRRGGCTEANPIAGQGVGGQVALLVGGTVANDLASHYLMKQGHPKWARVVRWLGIGVSGAMIGRNLRVMGRC